MLAENGKYKKIYIECIKIEKCVFFNSYLDLWYMVVVGNAIVHKKKLNTVFFLVSQKQNVVKYASFLLKTLSKIKGSFLVLAKHSIKISFWSKKQNNYNIFLRFYATKNVCWVINKIDLD